MRAALVLLAMASPAMAVDRYVFNNAMFDVGPTDPAAISPLDFHWSFDWPGVGPISYMLQDLTPADLGREWIITEANAATIGLDWTLFSDALLNHFDIPRYYSNGDSIEYRPTSTIDTPLGVYPMSICCGMNIDYVRPLYREYGVLLDHLRLSVQFFNYWPADGVTYVGIHTDVQGTAAQFVPEPSVLVLLATPLLMRRRHHTPHPARK